MTRGIHLLVAALLLAAGVAAARAADGTIDLYAGKTLPSWQLMVSGFESPEQALRGDRLTLRKPEGSHAPQGFVTVRAGEAAGRQGALTLRFRDAWHAGLRLDGGTPLDLRGYTGGTLEFDINVAELSSGGLYFTMRCGPECMRKVPYVLAGRALQGRGWQRLAFSLRCFVRDGDDFSKVPVPFALEGNGSGEVSLANIQLRRDGKPNANCPDYRSQAFTPEPLGHAWALENWQARHEGKLAELRRLRAEGKQPELVFIGDSITEGWEHAGQPVWQRHYARHNALALGFGGDHTENVLWRLQHGEIDGIAPKVAVLMIGTNNAGDRQDDPQATAAGIKAILAELRARLPRTKVLLLAIFPREQHPAGTLRRLNERVNALIAGLADGHQVQFANINSALQNADGTLSPEIMPDMLHLSEKGYDAWARALEPILAKLMAE